MKRIDAHTHTWGRDTDELPWQASVLPPEWEGTYTHRQLIADMDRVGVDETVIVSTPLYGRGERANEYTMRSIEAHPDRLYGVGIMNYFPDSPSTLREALHRVVGHDRMLGVRMHAGLAYDPIPTELDRHGEWILDAGLEPFWEAMADLEKCVFVFPKADQLSMLADLAAEHPQVTFVIDHMAWPDEQTAPNERPWADFEAVADHDNVYVKVSALPRSSDGGWPYEDLHAYVRNLIEWFGPERLMQGSDYPWMSSWAAYEDCLSWVEGCAFLSRRDRAYLSYRTFENLHT